eukprot:TRINITY_DN29471_c0_g1_i1.p1 TRINITY_DN29471_c0_g1~~TRINITY_DN29471_c0_g1_i1.p1  ORF type:complete len:122 (+),score=31.29 TRINITY_DN29471_c0_g1_i1:154-519(+)
MMLLNSTSSYTTRTSDKQGVAGKTIKYFTWDLVEKTTGLKPNVIIFDCEGCWYDVVKENKDKLSQVNTILLENDHPPDQNHLAKEGLQLIISLGFQEDPDSTGRINKLGSVYVFRRGSGRK